MLVAIDGRGLQFLCVCGQNFACALLSHLPLKILDPPLTGVCIKLAKSQTRLNKVQSCSHALKFLNGVHHWHNRYGSTLSLHQLLLMVVLGRYYYELVKIAFCVEIFGLGLCIIVAQVLVVLHKHTKR